MTSSAGSIRDQREARQVERLAFFSDAVFAIAMTLLIVEVRLPHLARLDDRLLAQALLDLIPNYVGFLVSFLVLARFWAAHHHVMGLLRAASPRLVWVNLLLLLAVAFMPFPTAVISNYIQLRVGIGFYAAWLIVLGLFNRWMIVLASSPELVAADVDPTEFVRHRRVSWIPILIGVSALVLGMITPLLSLVALMLGSPLISWVIRRRWRSAVQPDSAAGVAGQAAG